MSLYHLCQQNGGATRERPCLNLQGNADGGTVRSPPLHRGDSELPKSGSTIQGAPGETCSGKPRKWLGEQTAGRSIKLGGKTPR